MQGALAGAPGLERQGGVRARPPTRSHRRSEPAHCERARFVASLFLRLLTIIECITAWVWQNRGMKIKCSKNGILGREKHMGEKNFRGMNNSY